MAQITANIEIFMSYCGQTCLYRPTILKGWNWNLVLTFLDLVRCDFSVIWFVDFTFIVFTLFFFLIKKWSILTHKICWHDVQIKNGNYIFAVSLNRMLHFLSFRKERKRKTQGFQWPRAYCLRFLFLLIYLMYAFWNNYQHRGRVRWGKCYSLRIIYSSDQKHTCKP